VHLCLQKLSFSFAAPIQSIEQRACLLDGVHLQCFKECQLPDDGECPIRKSALRFCRDSPPVSAAPTPSADREPARFTEVPLPSALSGKSDMEVRQTPDMCFKRGVEGLRVGMHLLCSI
jgi:hypothetical protein